MQPSPWYANPTRASDADRADVCAILDNAYATGELDADEHRQRCASAMAAKTRGQLLGMVADLQAKPPAFSQDHTTAIKPAPKRKWIVGAAAAGALAAAALFALIATWHGGSGGPPTQTHGVDTGGAFLPRADVVGEVSGDFQDLKGHPPQRVDCPGDLAGTVGASERCSIEDGSRRYTADVTVTAVDGNRITTHDSIDETVSPPPSRP
ncbi:DUF1707 domain-containing protein [Mycobacterium sp. Marseille-P9652]|uniref:DUF1707 domain-containing protein n=1 Tax=Mycobacterium sp. Marseille-P9652 TaxID=2654950 RepID=UPI001E54B932|nr:DUF1707 domain-containing protein [Mycobacterium sp. Marseille-P9652]